MSLDVILHDSTVNRTMLTDSGASLAIQTSTEGRLNMTGIAINESQASAARVAGLAYLLVIPFAIFAEFYVWGQLLVSDNAAATANNIIANELLFRLGTASNLFVFAVDVVLITALYVVLKPVNRHLALLAAFLGLVETSTLIAAAISDLTVLRILSGADYLNAFGTEQLGAMARLSIGAHGAAYNVGLVFAGLRSAVFCHLWLKSGFVPKPLAALGVLSSLLLAAITFTFIVFPALSQTISVSYYAGPIFLFELTMGFWLLLRALKLPTEVRTS